MPDVICSRAPYSQANLHSHARQFRRQDAAGVQPGSQGAKPGSQGASLTCIALLVAALLASPGAYAQSTHLRLGAPEIQSSLGSPLWVRIPIDVANPAEEVSASRFSLGSKPANASIPFLESGEVTFERVGPQYFVVIRSRRSIDDPAIGIVMREQLPNGVRSREFIILLDPPPLASPVAVRSVSGDVAPAQVVQSIPPAPVIVDAAPSLPAATNPVAAKVAPAPTTAAPARPRRSRTPAQVQPAADVNVPPIASIAAPRATVSRESRADRAARISRLQSQPAQSPAPANAAIAKLDRRGPKLSLTLSTDTIAARPAASEAERAALRERQLLMDVDDLTAALMDRHHKILRLEKEFADLSKRVAAAEQFMNSRGASIGQATANPAATQAAAGTAPLPAAAADAPVVAAKPLESPVVQPAATTTTSPLPAPPKAAPVEALSPAVTGGQSWSLPKILLIALSVLALAGLAWWALRRRLQSRDQDFRIVPQRADEYVEEVLAARPIRSNGTGTRSTIKPALATAAAATPQRFDDKTVEMKAPVLSKPVAAEAVPEIHFELPATPSHLVEKAQATPGIDFDLSTPAANAEPASPPDDLRSRRMRYLQSRYQDIAILKPAIDAPQRLLRQAATLYDEGAADFAKRLLKYAAYSRPHAEEFWLALLELLYREQFANDYVVNAKWFQQYHGQSKQWDEVQRIGYLLDATEPMFASAAAWSHEAPVVGTWLPSAPAEAKPISSSLSHLKLELAN
ncbi:MAG: hypothetical protein ABI905_09530 [Betaproteobacteria bacterium]